MRRLESRPPANGTVTVVWGPWNTPIQLHSVIASIDATGGIAFRRPFLSVNLVGAGEIQRYFGSLVFSEEQSVISCYANAPALPDVVLANFIDPVTGAVTYATQLSPAPCVIALPEFCLIPQRATLSLVLVSGVITDTLDGLIATVEDMPAFRDGPDPRPSSARR